MKISLIGLSLMLSATSFAKDFRDVQSIQKAIINNKQTIESFLEAKGHSISSSMIARLEAERNLNIFEDISDKSPLGNLLLSRLSQSMVTDGYKNNYFKGTEAMANMLSPLISGPATAAASPNAPKVYTLTVLNPEHVDFVGKAAENFKSTSETTSDDHLLSLVGSFLDNSISAKKFVTYAEAETLLDNIAKMNADMDKLEAEAVGLNEKSQKRLDNFKEKMDEWINKKIVFLRLNHNGLNLEVIQDRRLVVAGDTKNNVGLDRSFTTSAIAQKIRTYYRERTLDPKNRGSIKLTVTDDQGKSKKISISTDDRIEVTVSIDRSSALIQTSQATFRVALTYLNANKLKAAVSGKTIYDSYDNNDNLVAIRAVNDAKEVMLKSVNKNLGDDWFARELGKNTFLVK